MRINGKHTFLGYFYDEVEAAKAYDRAAKKYHGDFAALNFPNSKRFLSYQFAKFFPFLGLNRGKESL